MKVRRTVRLIVFHNVGQNQGRLLPELSCHNPTNCDEGQQQTDRSNGSQTPSEMKRWNWENYKYFPTKISGKQKYLHLIKLSHHPVLTVVCCSTW